MKVAYCINDNGEKFEVKATDKLCEKYTSKLNCPYCGIFKDLEKIINMPVMKPAKL